MAEALLLFQSAREHALLPSSAGLRQPTISRNPVAMCARMSASYQVGGLTTVADLGDNGGLALEDLAGKLRFATLQVVWRQWQALGAEAASRSVQGRRPLQTLVDPEALLLVSLALIGHE